VKLVRRIVAGLVALILGASAALGEDLQWSTADQVSPPLSREQLDQMLAPIALYPDPLLADILMAATYPLEVVEADRWIQDPAHAKLDGDRLAAVLEQEPWDPSVKSLVPFPQILKMMDYNLEWTERLGEAFLGDQAGVMDSIQRLREEAKAAGNLNSTAQQTVTTEGEGTPIAIEPPNPEDVYVQNYSPSVVYGTWPYPSYPPVSFPGFLGGDIIVLVIAPLCRWHHWDWVHHRIDIDRDRFAVLNRNHQPIGGVTWEHDPLHRQGVPYRVPAARVRFDGRNAAPEVRVLRGSPPMIESPEIRSAARAVEQLQTARPAPVPHGPSTFGRSAAPEVRILRGHPTIGTPEVRPFLPAVEQPQTARGAPVPGGPSTFGRSPAPEARILGGHPMIGTPEVRPFLSPQLARPAPFPHTPSTFEPVNHAANARMGRQLTIERVAPARGTATDGGGGRVSPYGQQR
jgi:Protein of unknown function (DUF3300)